MAQEVKTDTKNLDKSTKNAVATEAMSEEEVKAFEESLKDDDLFLGIEEEEDTENSEEEQNDDTTAGDTAEESNDDEIGDKKQVPLNKYVDEKHKRQEVEAERDAIKIKLLELQGNHDVMEIDKYIREVKDKYIKSGMDEEYADLISKDLAGMRKDYFELKRLSQATGANNAVDKYTMEIAKLKNESGYYDNADAFSDKIKEKMMKFELSAKEAYNIIVDPVLRSKELEQRAKSKPSTEANTSSTIQSSASKPAASKLDKQDQRVLRQLQKDDPNNNWTEKKYLEMVK